MKPIPLKCYLMLLFLFLGVVNGYSQDLPTERRTFPITLSLLSESISWPPLKGLVKGPHHVGLKAGTEFTYRKGKNSQWLQTAQVGYYYHRQLHTGLSLQTDLIYRYTTGLGLFADMGIGAGYLHTISDQPAFKRQTDNSYRVGTLHLYRFRPAVNIGAGIDLSVKHGIPVGLHIQYELSAEVPGPIGSIALPHNMLLIGGFLLLKK